jgi:N,N'-diacetyllegionaminate synthase
MKTFRFGNRVIGEGLPVLVIAEAGVNHNGDMQLAHQLIDAAVATGADVVKFQSFVTEEIATAAAPKAGYQRLTTDTQESQFRMLKSLELSEKQHLELQAHCREAGIVYLSTPYDLTSLDSLDRQGVAGFKIASTDTTNLPFLEAVGEKKRPVILSTGMSAMDEVEEAVAALQKSGADFCLLHCTSEYPAPLDELNLRAIATLRDKFNCVVGFSDHAEGIDAATWAVAMGACVIEKHFTLDRTLAGPDHAASIEPTEMARMISKIRQLERSLGSGVKTPTASELANKPLMQKSLVAIRPIAAGEQIRREDLTCKRPGTGLRPSMLGKVIGKRAALEIKPDQVLTHESVVWDER